MKRKEAEDDFTDELSNEPNISDVLVHPEITKAINIAVKAWADTQPTIVRHRFWALVLGIAFSVVVLVVIGALGYLNVISHDVTGSLVSGLIGYWYGKYQVTKS